MFKFIPLTEEELNQPNLLVEGDYPFTVIQSTSKISKSNNEMAEIKIEVTDEIGKKTTLLDWLVFSVVPLNIKKVKHFCDATGLKEEYKKGEIPENLCGRKGYVKLGIQDEQPDSKGGMYPRKNIVVDYIESKEESFKDDTIPF